MAQPDAPNSAGRPGNPWPLCIEACKTDNVSLMEQAISIASIPGSRGSVQDVVQRGMKSSAARNSLLVLRYVLDHGADVGQLTTESIFATDEELKPSQEVFETLIAHGWNINTQGPLHTSWPLLWRVVQHHDLVVWCLDHGARVDVPEDSPPVDASGVQMRSGRPRPTILGMAASFGSVETFELLRDRSAPLDPRTLHRAVQQATYLAPWDKSDGKSDDQPGDSSFYARRLDMIRHLIDVVKLDINAIAYEVGSFCATPLCVAASRPTNQDFRELVSCLLDRGADLNKDGGTVDGIHFPTPMTCPQPHGNGSFHRAVQEWQANQQGSGTE